MKVEWKVAEMVVLMVEKTAVKRVLLSVVKTVGLLVAKMVEKLAAHGLIHGDFNEFNLLVSDVCTILMHILRIIILVVPFHI